MIIWINGPFGGGKTHIAHELHRRLSNSVIFDPEKVGFFIRSNMTKDLYLSDFKDYKLWRDATKYFLDKLDITDRVVLVPMTLTNKVYYKEIILPLKSDHIVNHITLLASKETIERRLLKRGDSRKSWTYKRVEECLKELDNQFYNDRIYTDSLDIYEIVEIIGNMYGLNLKDDHRNRIQKSWDRLNTVIKNLRLKEMIFGY